MTAQPLSCCPKDAPERDPADVAAPDSYQSGQPVWIYRTGAWRPGLVMHAGPRAVLVRYRPTASAGTGVDTALGVDLVARDGVDELLETPAPPRRR